MTNFMCLLKYNILRAIKIVLNRLSVTNSVKHGIDFEVEV